MVLEIRVHGVSNTPPSSTLHEWSPTPPDVDDPDLPEPKLVDGDATTGFYQRPGPPPRRGLVVLAYSWGQLTQGSRINRRDLQRAAWALLLPFALANVAVWAVPEGRPFRRSEFASFVARCLALSLTVTFALGFSGVSMSEVAWQCHGGCEHNVPYTGFLRDGVFSVGLRPVAVAMLAPTLAMVVLLLIARRSFAYEAQVPATAVGTPGTNEFRRPHFWSGARQIAALTQLHLAAALTAVAILATSGAAAASRGHRHLFRVETTLLALLAVLIVVALLHPCVRSREPREGAGPLRLLLLLSVGGWLGAAGSLLLAPTASHRPYAPQWPTFSGAISGLFYAQVACVLLLAVLAAAPAWRWAVAAAAAVVAVLVGWHQHAQPGRMGVLGFLAVVAALVTVAVVLLAPAGHDYTDTESPPPYGLGAVETPADGIAWRGKAAALFAGAGLMLAVIYMAAALNAVANWLNGPHPVTGASATVRIPTALLWSGLGLITAVLGVLAVAVWAWGRYRRDCQRALAGESLHGERRLADDYGEWPPYEQHRADEVATARALHSFDGWTAVPMLGGLAAIGLGICVVGAVLTALGLDPAGPHGPFVRGSTPDQVFAWLTNVGGSVSAFVVVVIGFVLLNIYRSDGPVRRVFGVVWDLATFWPRAAHPFAPPCYAERAVPQLVTKIAGQHGTILATHSQGTLIGMATLLQLPDVSRVRFLTYGTQLNRLYGRIFPLLCGRRERDALADHLGQPSTATPVGDLRWVSFWRPTDFIGWSVGSRVFDLEVVDPAALTGAPGEITLPPMHRHSDYPLSREYVETRNALVDGLRRRPYDALMVGRRSSRTTPHRE